VIGWHNKMKILYVICSAAVTPSDHNAVLADGAIDDLSPLYGTLL